jgi:predicted lipoprotein with Yx(FWY)xxD motif
MHRPASSPNSRLGQIVLASLALLLIAASGSAGARSSKVVAKQVESATLGKTVLANLRGHTLYSLSAEKNGRFICTGSCLSSWRPLLVPANTKPTGPVKLGTIQRPEGKTQVTYRGRPLYAFVNDSKPGEANGEGIKDVGTWHAATVAASPAQPSPSQPQPEPGYPY